MTKINIDYSYSKKVNYGENILLLKKYYGILNKTIQVIPLEYKFYYFINPV